MIHYRPFRNTDPPELCEIWRSQPPLRGLMQPMVPELLEHHVLAKGFFERRGLIVAEVEGRIVGFAHAGFGPSELPYQLDYQVGGTAMVMARELPQRGQVMQGLLQACETYLLSQGARQLYGGGTRQVAPFYLGLYGGSDLHGVLGSDTLQTDLFQQAGYTVRGTSLVMQRELSQYRPPVNREAMQLRRQSELAKVPDLPPENWWEASLTCEREREQFQLTTRDRRKKLATASFWDLEPLATSWGVHAIGLWQLDLADEPNRSALATYFLGECLFALAGTGRNLVEMIVDEQDAIRRDAATALGFREVDRMVRFVKERTV